MKLSELNPTAVAYASVSITQNDMDRAREYERVHKDCENKVLQLAKELREEWAKVGIHHTENATSIAIAKRLV